MTNAEENYRNRSGIIVMCMYCRRTQSKAGARWDRVEEFIQNRPKDVSDGLCDDCMARYYSSQKS